MKKDGLKDIIYGQVYVDKLRVALINELERVCIDELWRDFLKMISRVSLFREDL